MPPVTDAGHPKQWPRCCPVTPNTKDGPNKWKKLHSKRNWPTVKCQQWFNNGSTLLVYRNGTLQSPSVIYAISANDFFTIRISHRIRPIAHFFILIHACIRQLRRLDFFAFDEENLIFVKCFKSGPFVRKPLPIAVVTHSIAINRSETVEL